MRSPCLSLAHMIHVDPVMTLIIGVVFLPQFTFLPLMQAAINQRTQRSISPLRGLSCSLTDPRSAATDRDSEGEVIDRVFGLSAGIFKLKYSLNFLINLGTHLQIIIALLCGGWLVLTSQLEIGGAVAFISGISRLTDPWGDLMNYFRDVSLTKVKYDLLVKTVNLIAERGRADDPAH
jgi:ABC-type multidrug transport system fused ATPase/permease subunit